MYLWVANLHCGCTLLLVCAIYVMTTTCNTDCEDINNQTPDGKLDFVFKNNTEWNNKDLVTEDGWVQLLCEVNNFCELIWYDNVTGQPILEEEGFIKFKDQNQTLTIFEARKTDARTYTCKASEGKETLERTIVLNVLSGTPGSVSVAVPSLPTCGNATADIGETVTVCCQYTITEGFLLVEPSWKKFNETDNTGDGFQHVSFLNDINEQQEGVTTRYQEFYNREESEGVRRNGFLIFDTTLVIHNISDDAYGLHQLFVAVDGNAFKDSYEFYLNPKPVPKILKNGLIHLGVSIGVVVTIVVMFLFVYLVKKLEIQICWKDICDCQSPDRKHVLIGDVQRDAYISYCHNNTDTTSDDVDFVVNVLKERLEGQGYTTDIRDINHRPGTNVHEEIVKSLDRSRRCILVISPAYLKSWIGSYDVKVGVDTMQSYKRQIIPIIYKDISQEPDNDSHKLLKHIMQDHKCLQWPEADPRISEKKLEKKKKTFFNELMLKMPPLRLVSQTSSLGYFSGTSGVGLTSSVESISETTPPATLQRNGHPSIYPTCPDSNNI